MYSFDWFDGHGIIHTETRLDLLSTIAVWQTITKILGPERIISSIRQELM
jgi:hypothetical protein